MEIKTQNQSPVIDEQLIRVFKKTFGNDERAYKEAIHEARRAFAFIKEDALWNDLNSKNDEL